MYMMCPYKKDNLWSVKSKSEIISHLHQQMTSQQLLSPGNYLSDTLFVGLNTDLCTWSIDFLQYKKILSFFLPVREVIMYFITLTFFLPVQEVHLCTLLL